MRPGWAVAGMGITLILLCLVCISATATGSLTPAQERKSAPTLTPTPTPGKTVEVLVDDVDCSETLVTVTLTIRKREPVALLFEVPLLSGESPAPESLERARLDILDAAVSGQAQIVLEFHRPPQAPPWTLVFNPGSTPHDAVAPRVEVEILREE